MLQLENPLWQFSLAVYRKHEVAKECLRLQEELDGNVNVFLFCAWAGRIGMTMQVDEIFSAVSVVQRWQIDVTTALRNARTSLKSLLSGDYATGIDDLRRRILELELQTEQIQQALLYGNKRAILQSAIFTDDRQLAVAWNVRSYIAVLRRVPKEQQQTLVGEHLIAAATEYQPGSL